MTIRWTRRAARGAVVLFATVGLAAAPAGPAGAAGLEHLVAAAASDVYVAVVVQFGSGAGAPAPVVACVKVPQGSTDADALAAAVGQSNVGYSNSGLLCAIDNFPANGVANCTATSNQDYYYWSYWHGATGTWSYANNGPAEQLASTGDVQGWRFQDPGPAGPSAPAPSTAPSYATICAGAVDTTATTGAPVTPSSGSQHPGQTASGSATGGAAGTKTQGPAQQAAPSSGAPSAANPSNPAGGGTSPPGQSTSTTNAATPRGSTSTLPDNGSAHDHGETGRAGALAAPLTAHHSGGGGGGPPTAVLAVITAVAVLGGAAAWRWRRQSRVEAVEDP
jgi:hypothetical protein